MFKLVVDERTLVALHTISQQLAEETGVREGLMLITHDSNPTSSPSVSLSEGTAARRYIERNPIA